MPHPVQARNAELRAELQRLQADNAVLAHRVAREQEKARHSTRRGHWALLCPFIMAARPWHGHTPAAQAYCSQARDSERDRARLETELSAF